ncbi:MAG: dihydroorotate dehydrogenase electron transfer subunit [Candidatus Poribacteria bacterium]|nr:dihydroorotate dehydrogenase electron transfer subunit [Candidatus Poribacteria bacterium]
MPTVTSERPKKFDLVTKILANEQAAQDHYLLRCECPEIAEGALPGQFIHVLISDASALLLRRPFTIYSVEGDQITILYQRVGAGTDTLSHLGRGDSLHVMGPLGNNFSIPPNLDSAIIVGGGAGIASLMLHAAALRKLGTRTLGLVGSINAARLLSVADLEAIEVETHISTDDGSIGHHGFVTEILTQILEQPQVYELHNPVTYACGPYGMLRAVAKISRKFRVPMQLAMENRMGCAMGVCLGCVCKVRTPDGGFEYQRVCTEGPVFDAEDIVW